MTGSVVPKDILTQHIAVLGKTRSGKSSVMRLLVEGLLEAGKPVCIVDPKGDWWGLKLATDGKHPGYPVVIFGGEHADVPINEHAGAHVAELFATGNRPCLIDLGGWMVGPRTRFWIDFASTLFKHTKGQRWLAVDEIHNFAPKGKVFDAEAGKALHWTNRLASEGLGKGIALVFASQRPQKVHNDTLTSAETLIAMRVLHPSDRGAVSDWIKGCGDSEGSEVLNSLAQMERGEGWVWSPEIGFGPKRVKFPLFHTYDSFRPQSVEDAKKLKGWAEVDLDEVRAKLASVMEQAKQDDPRELRKQLAALKQQIATSIRRDEPTLTPKQLEQLKDVVKLRRQLDAAMKFLVRVRTINFDGRHTKAMQEAITEAVTKITAAHEARLAQMADTIERLKRDAEQSASAIQALVSSGVDLTVDIERRPPQPAKPAATVVHPARSTSGGSAEAFDGSLGKGERVVLTAVAQHQAGVTREQLTVLTGYARSSRDTYLQRLSQAGLVAPNGHGTIRATEAGMGALGDFEPLPTGDALRAYWLRELPEGERRVLEVLVKAYPTAVARTAIDDATGYARSSRDTYLQRLGARKLIETERGEVRASSELFS